MEGKVISFSERRDERERERLIEDLREFVEEKVAAGEPVVVVVERKVSSLSHFLSWCREWVDEIRERR